MLTNDDIQQIRKKGITREYLDWQLSVFKNGVPYIRLDRPAIVGDGIIHFSEQEVKKYSDVYNSEEKITKIKFVPASGAASRMFKALYEYIDAASQKNIQAGEFVKKFIVGLEDFAFFDELNFILKEHKLDYKTLINEGHFLPVIKLVLNEEGLNYGNLPKGLLKFHKNNTIATTPFEEHMVEAAMYARSGNTPLRIHFTVSPEHQQGFTELLAAKRDSLEKRFGVSYQIDFSIQSPSTDTLAVDEDNQPFRNEDGSILFRPGGHGALIGNLDKLDSDIIFIKNIDNVVPERLIQTTVSYKKALAGKLLEVQRAVFSLIREINNTNISMKRTKEILSFVRNELCFQPVKTPDLSSPDSRRSFLLSILDRPIRVCGVVKNLGEPGGGPFWAPNSQGDITLQIVESSQIDNNDTVQKEIFGKATHFNPVDIVGSPKRFDSSKFKVLEYVDKNTCFISKKSKDGQQLKALELPGLWNGSMADWLTLFVEVPVETFNPVKTVNDLLRPQHQ